MRASLLPVKEGETLRRLTSRFGLYEKQRDTGVFFQKLNTIADRGRGFTQALRRHGETPVSATPIKVRSVSGSNIVSYSLNDLLQA